MSFAISVEGLSKRYELGAGRPADLRGAIAAWFRSPGARSTTTDAASRSIWALDRVSFEVAEGETVGIIGANGSGKSTLLKLLARITGPTSGRAAVRGRLAALLEVGTGFHPDLTGRDNVFLNGTILGMSRNDIKRQFDAIVDFAGVARFIDTPVKHYSSGMYLRLAFAVAAHLTPDVLVVDEVLAVGDLEFQRKSMAKMGDVTRDGRTVIFVSHNLGAVQALCTRALLLERGKLVADGPTEQVLHRYLARDPTMDAGGLASRFDRTGSGRLRFTGFRALAGTTRSERASLTGEPLELELVYEAREPIRKDAKLVVGISFRDALGRTAFLCSTEVAGARLSSVPTRGVLRCRIPELPLIHGVYGLNFFVSVDGEVADYLIEAASLTVESGLIFGAGTLPETYPAHVVVRHEWGIEERS